MAAPNSRRTLMAVVVAILLFATGGGSIWLVASSGALSGGAPNGLGGEQQGGTAAQVAGALFAGEWFKVEQPRDPFAPLITVPAPVTSAAGSSTTGGGSSTTGGSGTTSSTAGGSTTTTTVSDHPAGTRVALLEIRTEGGAKVAVLTVDGVTYTEGVGDTFADGFKVVSLGSDSGVFMYGTTVFTLVVGQSIIK